MYPDVTSAQYLASLSSTVCSIGQKLLMEQGLAPHVLWRSSQPAATLLSVSTAASTHFSGHLWEQRGGSKMTNLLRALWKYTGMCGVCFTQEDEFVLEVDPPAQTSWSQHGLLMPCTPAACWQWRDEEFGGNWTPHEISQPPCTKVLSIGVSIIVMHEGTSWCSVALGICTSTCLGRQEGRFGPWKGQD